MVAVAAGRRYLALDLHRYDVRSTLLNRNRMCALSNWIAPTRLMVRDRVHQLVVTVAVVHGREYGRSVLDLLNGNEILTFDRVS